MIAQPALVTEGANVPRFLVKHGIARADVSAWCEKVAALRPRVWGVRGRSCLSAFARDNSTLMNFNLLIYAAIKKDRLD
jgi:hypothetical protein